jgi:hypothetical protein
MAIVIGHMIILHMYRACIQEYSNNVPGQLPFKMAVTDTAAPPLSVLPANPKRSRNVVQQPKEQSPHYPHLYSSSSARLTNTISPALLAFVLISGLFGTIPSQTLASLTTSCVPGAPRASRISESVLARVQSHPTCQNRYKTSSSTMTRTRRVRYVSRSSTSRTKASGLANVATKCVRTGFGSISGRY